MIKKMMKTAASVAAMVVVSLQSAFAATTVTTEAELKAAVADGGEITLGADIALTEMLEVASGRTVTLDLSGKAITVGYQSGSTDRHLYPFDVYGTMTIKDSAGNGSITGRGIYVQNGSKVTLESGAVYGIDSNGGSAFFQYGGDIVINGGRVEQKAEGTYNFAINAAAGTVTVNGGWVGGNHGAIAAVGAAVVIKDGEFVCTGTAGMTDNVLYSYGTGSIIVNGGTFTADNDGPAGGCCVYDANGGATINGGIFGNSSGGDVWGTTGTTINGGTFEDLRETSHVTVGATIINGGKTYTKTESGLTEVTAVARIGDVKYTTIQDAIDAAQAGETVVLLTDVVLDAYITIPAGKDLIIDLYSKTVTAGAAGTYGYTLYNAEGSTVTIKDSLGGGKMVGAIENNKSTMIIDGGIFTALTKYVIANISGTMTINGGTINGKEDVANYAVFSYKGKNSTVSHKLTINDVTVNGTFGCVNAYGQDGEVVINGGAFNFTGIADKTSHIVYTHTNTRFTINGGTFQKVGNVNISGGGGICTDGNGNLTITGGTFANTSGSSNVYNGKTTDTIAISGGTYTVNPKAYLAAGYTANANADGTYGVALADNVVAAVGDTAYATLEEAIIAAAPAGTVEILTDVTIDQWTMFSETLSISSGQIITIPFINGLTIDGNGHTITIKSIESAGNGGYLFYDATNLNVKDVTITCVDTAANAGGIGLTSGTIENVVFEGGRRAVYPGTGDITITGCTFKTTSNAIYYESARDNLKVTGNTFECGDYAIIMYGKETFTGNKVTSGKVNIASTSSATVTGNDFGANRFKVYNGATATIKNNEINNLEFSATTTVGSTFTDNNFSDVAQTIYNDAMAVAVIGTTKYMTLAEALAAAKSGDTIELRYNVAVSGTAQIPAGVTIDLNGKDVDGTISALGDITILGGGYIKTLSSVSGGTITVEDNTTLALNDFSFGTKSNNTAEYTITGGKITANYGFFQHGTYKLYSDFETGYMYYSYGSDITVYGTFHSQGKGDGLDYVRGKLTIAAGGKSIHDKALWVGQPASWGAMESALIVEEGGTLEIGNMPVYNGSSLVSAGNITGTITKETDATIAISGGTYTQAIPQEWCAAGYVPADLGNGQYGVAVDPAYGKAAQIGDVYYDTFAEALAAAQDYETVTLLTDLTIDAPISITKSICLDGDGHTLTYTGTNRAIDFPNNADANIDACIANLTVDCTASYCERGISFNESNGELYLDTVTVKGTNLTYAVNLPGDSDGAKITTWASSFTGNIALNIWGESVVINATNSHFISVDNSAEEDYAAIMLNNDGSIAATGTKVTVSGGSVIAYKEDGTTPSVAVSNVANGTLNINLAEVVGEIRQPVAVISYGSTAYVCYTLQDAIEAAKAGDTITLLADIESFEIIVLDKAITLDGNGKTLTSTAARAINVSGANGVTIKNLTINCTGERGINIIQGATNVTIDNVTIDANNYAVNVAGSAANAVVTVKNSDLTGLNVVNVGAVDANVTVTGTKLTNDNTDEKQAFAVLNLNKDATGGSITANGCTFTCGLNTVKGRNDAENGTITIDGSTDGVEVTVAYINYDNYYAPYTSLAKAIEAAAAGKTVTLIRDISASDIITIDKAITLDGNGKTLTSTAGRAINVDCNGNVAIKNLTINCSGERAINVINKPAKLTIDKVTATADNYTVNVAGSGAGAVVTITNSDLTGLNVVNVAGAGANVTVTDTKLTNNNTDQNQAFTVLNLNKDATGGTITANGCTFTLGINTVKGRNDAENGTITIDGTTNGVDVTVAYIDYGDYFAPYPTLAQAIDQAKDGDKVVFIRDITEDEIVTINKAITLDGNGKKLTSTAARAINVDCDGDVAIKNLTIVASGERAINVINQPANLTIENVTATAANYTVNVATSAGAAQVAITNSTLTGACTVNVAAPGAKVTIDNSTVNCVDNNTTKGESYAALSLNAEAAGGSIIATNATVTVTEGSDSMKGRNSTTDGTVTINGSTEDVMTIVAVITYAGSDYYHGVTSLAEAIEFAKAGDTITLIRNATEADTVTVAGKSITLDLNGKTVSMDKTSAAYSALIHVCNGATLTIVDTGTNGKIVYNSASVSGAQGALVWNEGDFVLQSGTLETLGTWAIGYAVDVRPNAWGSDYADKDVTFVMNGGMIKTSDAAIRVAQNSSDSYIGYSASFTMNGGEINSAATGIFIQQLTGEYDDLSVTITGGSITGSTAPIRFWGVEATGFVNGENGSSLTITGGDIATGTGNGYIWLVNGLIRVSGDASLEAQMDVADVTVSETFAQKATLAEGYEWVENSDGTYSMAACAYVAQIGETKYTSLTDAFAVAKNGDTITLLEDIETSETVTIADGVAITLDMNGKKITATDNKTSNYDLFYNYGELTVTGNGTIELTATTNREWNASSCIFHNRGGVLKINNGTFTHLGGTDMAFVIDNSANWYGDATTIINGGTLSSTYTAIRNRMEQNSHGASGKAYLTITAGSVDGDTSAIWAQAASTSETSPATGEITISGGTIGVVNTARSEGAECMTTISGGTVEKFKGEVGELTVTGGTLQAVEILNTDGTPADYAITDDGLYAPAVAKIGDVMYASLQDAIDAAQSGDTVKLIADVELSATVTVAEGKAIILDLNGKTINAAFNGESTTNHIYAFKNYGVLTITDSSTEKNGAINSRGNYNYGTLFLEAGTINAIDGNGGYAVWNQAGSAFTMNGGTVAATYEDDNLVDEGGYDATTVRVEAGAAFTMNDGVINNVSDFTFAIDNSGTTTVEGGTISSVHTTVRNNGTMTIDGGTFTCNGVDGETQHVVWGEAGTTTINGGTFNGKDTYNGFNVTVSEGATVNITGGTFLPVHSGSLYGEGTIAVSGGTFFDAVPEERCAEGYAALKNLDGMYVVGEEPTATVNNLGAMTIAESDYIVYGGSKSGDMPLNFVMQFLANQNAEDMKTSPYADWYADFVLTFEGLAGDSFTADGCYLAGYYGDFGWVKVPVDGMTIENGVRYPVMLGVDMGQKYDYICESVKDFRCAMYLTPEVLEANPNLKVKLELSIVDNSKGEDEARDALADETLAYVNVVGETSYNAEDFASYVAQVGETKYTSLQAAINAIETEGTIKLINNAVQAKDTQVVIPAGKTITLDLNGKTYTGGNYNLPSSVEGYIIANNGTLTIVDSSAEKTGVMSANGLVNGYGVIVNNGTLTLNGGTYTGSVWNGTSGDYPGYTLRNCGTLTINAGAAIENEFGCISQVGGTLAIGGGVITVTEGIGGHCVYASAGTVTINDGDFNPYNKDYSATSYSVYVNGADVTINGGDFEMEIYGRALGKGANGTLTVKGGTFTSSERYLESNLKAFLADGYAALKNFAGKYVVGVAPTATIENLGATNVLAGTYSQYDGSFSKVEDKDMPLPFVMKYVADETAEAGAASPFADWYGDFVITITGIESGSFVADGCYLAGHYGSFGWVKVPIDGLTVENGARYPVMLSALGTGQKYDYICGGVDTFLCALYLTPEILEANPNIQVSLELCVVDNSDGAEAAQNALSASNSSYAYQSAIKEFEKEDFVIASYVAQIGETKYTSLQDAIDAATEGQTVQLIADIELAKMVTVAEGKVITLDLNGKTINAAWNGTSTTNHIYALDNKGTLTITDSTEEKNGAINSRGVWNYGSLTLEAGKIAAIDGNGGYAMNNEPGSTFVMNGGWLAADNEDGDAPEAGNYDATALDVPSECTATLNGGKITNAGNFTSAIVNNGNLTITDVEVTSVHTTVANYGTMTIDGGTFTCNGIDGQTSHVIWGAEGTTTINGGTFNGKDNYNGFNVVASAGATVNITGGNFLSVHSGSLYGEGTIAVSGGTFFDAVPEERCAEGYIPVDNADGTYGVAPAFPTATVDKITASDDTPLTFALNFKADEVTPAQLAYYKSWYADFVLTITGLTDSDVTFNANGGPGSDGYLAGSYEAWNDGAWVSVPFDDVTLANGESIKIMDYASTALNQPGLKLTYNDVYSFVKDFNCGVYFTPEFLAANPNMKVSLTLRMYETGDASDEGVVIGEMEEFTAPVVVAKIGTTPYATLADAFADAESGDTITVLKDIALTETVTVADKSITLDLNGKTVSGVCDSSEDSLIYIENDAALTVKDSAEGGKLTYAGSNSTGYAVDLKGVLTLESGTIELTGSWSVGYAVNVRPNSWATEYTKPSIFTMNGGTVVSSDGAVRLASTSAEAHTAVSASFVMNDGKIDAVWDGVFIQQSNGVYDKLAFTMNAGTIESDLNPIRVYGPAPTGYVDGQECMKITLNGGTCTYTDTETREWIIAGILRVGGGSSADTIIENGGVVVSASFVANTPVVGYVWVKIGDTQTYQLAKMVYQLNIKMNAYNEPLIGFKTSGLPSVSLKAATNLENPKWTTITYEAADDGSDEYFWVKPTLKDANETAYRFFKLAE